MDYKIAVVKGDGIGPEVTDEAIKALDKIGEIYGHTFNYEEKLGGGIAIDETGEPLPQDTIDSCKKSDAVLFGAVGGPKWDNVPGHLRPEMAVLGLRKALGLYANLRPAIVFDELSDASPLKKEIIDGGLDILVVRELTGGIYFGPKSTEQIVANQDSDDSIVKALTGDKGYSFPDGAIAYDVELYSEAEIKRIGITAFEMARKRGSKVTSVDKANVLESSRLWRKVIIELSKEYPDVELDHLYVDNAAMQLVRSPKQFDVIVTSNIFGDILSDEASQITGSIGMLPSASLADGNFGLYEPIHGSAPDITGQEIANPIAAILSAAMLLRYSLSLAEEADAIENAVKGFLADGYRTPDIYVEGAKRVGTKEAGELIVSRIK